VGAALVGAQVVGGGGGHLAMNFEKQVAVEVAVLDLEHVEGVVEVHLAMHFEAR